MINQENDSITIYLNELSNYPLLTPNEEKQLAEDLKLQNNLKIINKISDIEEKLDLPLIFASCSKCKLYDDVIFLLVSYFSNKNSDEDKKIYKLLKQYKNISHSLGRALNIKELYDNFNMEINNDIVLDSINLLDQTKNYIKYREAYEKILVSNLRLVVVIAKKYKSNIDLVDLIQEGNIGLMKAIKRFDSSLGYKFSTYATYWIRHSINRYIENYDRKIRIPINVGCDIKKFRKSIDELVQQKGRILTPEELSSELKMPLSLVKEYLSYTYEFLSLDEPINEEGNYTLLDCIESNDDVLLVVCQNQLKEDIDLLFSNLSVREKQIIRMRFGLDNNKQMTLSEVGDTIGMSKARVRETERKALNKMRRQVYIDRNIRPLKDYLR